jgi:hypothetical protein
VTDLSTGWTERSRPEPRPTPEQLLFARVVYTAAQLHREGIAITAVNLHQYNMDVRELDAAEILSTPLFADAMAEQGIPLMATPGLSPEQLAAIAIYMDMTVPLRHAQKLKAAGVTQAKWNGWMRQAEFARHINQLATDITKASGPVARQRLAQLVDEGNLAAITLTFEMEGIHDRRKETVDANAMLMGIFNILDEEVYDRAILERIAARIKVELMGQAPILKITQPALGQPIEGELQ